MYVTASQIWTLVPFVELWPKYFGTWPLFLRDSCDTKMLRKWHPGKPQADKSHNRCTYTYCFVHKSSNIDFNLGPQTIRIY